MRASHYLLTLCLALSVSALAQAPESVRTFVHFEDRKTHEPVSGKVTPEMLQVRADGHPVSSFTLSSAQLVPATYLFLLDESGSGRRGYTHELRMALRQLADRIVEPDRDRLALVNFNDEYYLDMPPTNDVSKFAEALKNKEEYRGGTALFDTLIASSNYLKKNERPGERKVIVLLSDGADNASRRTFQQALEATVDNGVTVLAISDEAEARGIKYLAQIANGTGGRAFGHIEPKHFDDFVSFFKKVLDSEYVLSLVSPESKVGQRMKLEVSANDLVSIAPEWIRR